MAIQAINPQVQMPKAESKQNVNFNGFLDSKAFEKVAEFAGKNPATFNAASSLIMAGVLRPAAIMALPAKDEQEQKNKGIAAAHAIASGVIGFAITSTVMKPISAGLGKVMGNTEKYLPKMHEISLAGYKQMSSINSFLILGLSIYSSSISLINLLGILTLVLPNKVLLKAFNRYSFFFARVIAT